MRLSPDGRLLPRGVSYDPARRRYRVRLYCNDRVIWLTYARSLDDALRDYESALVRQQENELAGHVVRGASSLATLLLQRRGVRA